METPEQQHINLNTNRILRCCRHLSSFRTDRAIHTLNTSFDVRVQFFANIIASIHAKCLLKIHLIRCKVIIVDRSIWIDEADWMLRHRTHYLHSTDRRIIFFFSLRPANTIFSRTKNWQSGKRTNEKLGRKKRKLPTKKKKN